MAKVERKIHELDATNMSAGRLSAQIVTLLRGKNKPTFDPSKDAGDTVRVINVKKLKFTGRKFVQKDFLHHTMFPGGLKRVTMKKVFEENPGKVIKHAVMGMLPKNRQRNTMIRRLTIEE